ncbi:MAG TPA: hypothetical protein VN577_15360 [Terriglobales bacterium]|nr:hypothetical protein [Terriglobales bacterium]
MKKIALAMIAVLFLLAAPATFAQDRGSVGVYADYVRLKHADNANFWGLGGRVGFNIHPNVQLEGELSYNFAQSFTNTTTNGGVVSVNTTNLRLMHGLFGPKFQTTGDAVRVFAVMKGGFLNFSTDKNLGNQFSGINGGDTNGVFYPGGGVEFFAGWFGFRIEAGDLMYFDRGANHNLRLTIGPQFRF